ncbi:MAG: penicillin-binding protein 2 [Elusimicrobia bacterium]|nr:penicillin-binding protein 2 [Elusimicrobiota bacterium]
MDLNARLAAVAGLCLLPLAPLTFRLAHLQVMQHDRIESKVAGEVLRTMQESLPRADIQDRRGRLLAQSIPYWSCFVERSRLRDRQALDGELARLLGLPKTEVSRRLQGQERDLVVKNDLASGELLALSQARLRDQRLIEHGVGVRLRYRRFYPNGELGRSVLGLVGTDQNGLSGLELTFADRLKGRPRRLAYVRDGSGRAIYQSAESSAELPRPLRLTIDRDVQFHAEEVLRQADKQFHAKGGMILVLDPDTSEILAMAADPADPLRNVMVQDTYEPGSTFKMVTAAAALNESLVKESDVFFCENGAYEVSPGVVIHDHEPAGTLNLQGILERSSNIGAAKVVERVGAMRFYRYSRAFGFDIKTGISLPGETAGDMKPLAGLTRVVLAASSYGYGIGVSALQVANAYNALAGGGMLNEPAVVCDDAAPAADERPLEGPSCRRPVRVRRVISEATARTLTRMLEGVVESGTGVSARIPGYRVAGKTGTARKVDPRTGKYSTSAYMASFVGFLPLSRPRWTILVVIDEPKGQYYGAQVSAPIFAELGRRLLTMAGVPPDAPVAAEPARSIHLAAASHP